MNLYAGLRAAENARGLQGGAHHVVVRLLRGERASRSLRVEAQAQVRDFFEP